MNALAGIQGHDAIQRLLRIRCRHRIGHRQEGCRKGGKTLDTRKDLQRTHMRGQVPLSGVQASLGRIHDGAADLVLTYAQEAPGWFRGQDIQQLLSHNQTSQRSESIGSSTKHPDQTTIPSFTA